MRAIGVQVGVVQLGVVQIGVVQLGVVQLGVVRIFGAMRIFGVVVAT